VLTFAASFYVDLSSRLRGARQQRRLRRATASTAWRVTSGRNPGQKRTRPAEHPWLFLAE
jgi:hypothetical protein